MDILDKPFQWHLMEEYGIPWEWHFKLSVIDDSFAGERTARDIRWIYRLLASIGQYDPDEDEGDEDDFEGEIVAIASILSRRELENTLEIADEIIKRYWRPESILKALENLESTCQTG